MPISILIIVILGALAAAAWKELSAFYITLSISAFIAQVVSVLFDNNLLFWIITPLLFVATIPQALKLRAWILDKFY